MENAQQNRIKRNAKVVLIISCVFAVISSILLVLMTCTFPQTLEYGRRAEYLYENGVEVDAHIAAYYYNGGSGPGNNTIRGRFRIIYEYTDDNNRTYSDEYKDTVRCETRAERNEREQYIRQLIAEGKTKKMLIDDNGTCCLSIYKESLLSPKNLIISISLISVSSVVLGLCIFGIVRQTKSLRYLK